MSLSRSQPDPGRETTHLGAGPARFAWAAISAGALAAILLPGARAGAGLVIVAVALAIAAALAGPVADRLRSGALGVTALALAASAGLRDADWVVAGELAAAVALGSIAMSAPRGWRATALAAAVPLRIVSGAQRVAGAVRAALPTTPPRHAFAVGRGLVLAGLLVAIFGALFVAGDRAFAELVGGLLPDDVLPDDAAERLIIFVLVTALAGALAQAAHVDDTPARRPLLRLGHSEWLLALGALNLLFALFVAVQVAVLFGGDAYVRDTAGLDLPRFRGVRLLLS